MGLKKLFKRRSRNEVGKLGSSSKIDLTGHAGDTSRYCDESTASESSGTAKVMTLESFAKNRKWDAVVKLVQESHVDDWMTAVEENASNNHSEGSFRSLHQTTTPLHLVAANRAPVATIDAIIQVMRTKFEILIPEEAQDEHGRTPLHVAVAAGCEEETVVRLLAGEGLIMPAILKDENGMTALHMAAATPLVELKKKNVFAANPAAMQKWHKRRAMTVLMEEYPEAVYLRDCAGKTPVDYAKELIGEKEFWVQNMDRVCKEYQAEMASKEQAAPTMGPFEMSADLQCAEVPLIVPSKSGSCRDFTMVSSLRLEDVLDEGIIAPEPDDLSTIGDNEVEMDL